MHTLEEHLRGAAAYLKDTRDMDRHSRWALPVLLARVQAAEDHASTLLRSLSDVTRAHTGVVHERDQLRDQLRIARHALVWAALCDDPERSRAVCERYVTTLAPEDVAAAVVEDARASTAIQRAAGRDTR